MNKNALKGFTYRKGLTLEKLSDQLKLSRLTFQKKMDGRSDFKLSEILHIQEILQLTEKEMKEVFFTD